MLTFFDFSGPANDAGDPHFASVVLLAGMEGSNGGTTFTDESPAAHALTASSATTSTAQKQFGASSCAIATDASGVTSPDSADWLFGAGQYTIELWFYPTSANGFQALLYQQPFGSPAQGGWGLTLQGDNTVTFELGWDDGTTALFGAGAPNFNAWNHVAVDRDAAQKTRVYLNGSMVASNTATKTMRDGTSQLAIGNVSNLGSTNRPLTNGYIDEVRITKGVARYASDSGLVVPSAAFPRAAPLPTFATTPAIASANGFYGDGDPLTVTPGTVDYTSTMTYQWRRDGAAIGGATTTGYTLTASDVGAIISVTQTATNSGGSVSSTSAGVGPIVTPAFATDPLIPAGDMQSGSDALQPAGDMQSGSDNLLWSERTA